MVDINVGTDVTEKLLWGRIAKKSISLAVQIYLMTYCLNIACKNVIKVGKGTTMTDEKQKMRFQEEEALK